MVWFEFAVSTLMGTIGGYMMIRGKKIQNVKMIVWGGVLVVLSYFLFSAGSGNDDASKAVLKTLMPGATEQQQQQP